MNRHLDFISYRKNHPTFSYNSFDIKQQNKKIIISFDFAIDGLASFKPEIKISTENLQIINPIDSEIAKHLAFLIGMTEAISYWKAACPPNIQVFCGNMSEEESRFWKKLYYNGLGEFFYINEIKVSKDEMFDFKFEGKTFENQSFYEFNLSGKNIIPIGGGKDSAVTTELLKPFYDDNLFFIVNEQKARTETVKAGGYDESRIIKLDRKISPELLELNAKGFLNGHTPFSAILAFVSLYTSYITGANNIVLSNENSANEASVLGSDINHQYSKSYEFESDFQEYISSFVTNKIHYFSLLRPFSEFHIAKKFAALPEYHKIFRSCNVGSKTNSWCCKCAKCLFIYSILSPFLESEKLISIFGKDLLEDISLLDELKGLIGILPVKPFECVGTIAEIRYALALCTKHYKDKGKNLPALLKYFESNINIDNELNKNHEFLKYNNIHSIPKKFEPQTKEMYEFVTGGL